MSIPPARKAGLRQIPGAHPVLYIHRFMETRHLRGPRQVSVVGFAKMEGSQGRDGVGASLLCTLLCGSWPSDWVWRQSAPHGVDLGLQQHHVSLEAPCGHRTPHSPVPWQAASVRALCWAVGSSSQPHGCYGAHRGWQSTLSLLTSVFQLQNGSNCVGLLYKMPCTRNATAKYYHDYV